MSTPFLLGVNYWPRRKAMGWWRHFEADEVRQEFALLNQLGLRLVRLFLLWEDWQPTAETVSPTTLAHLHTVADIAAEYGLQLDITFFTGHMSGPNWVPPWMLLPDEPLPRGVNQVVSGGKVVDCGYRNPYHDPLVWQASELLVRTVVGALAGHSAVAIWNLGNEPDLFAIPHTAADGRAWARHFTQLIKTIDPHTPVTCGLHVPDLTEDLHLRANDIFAEVDIPAIHGYPMYCDWAKGPLDTDFVPYLCALTSALCGKPTLAEEFGGCTVGQGEPAAVWEWTGFGRARTQYMANEEAFAAYIGEVLPKLVQVGALGAVLWCFADYAPQLWNQPPCDEAIHERFFGLVRPDGSLKPHAEVLRQFAATQPQVQPAQRTVVLDVSPEAYYAQPALHAQRLYQQFKQGR